ncbi:glycosyltransferase family 39 protein [Chloroflexota bacterium]|nr:glycosyltransferase family 39 protein [Chloroflexota bacterium]
MMKDKNHNFILVGLLFIFGLFVRLYFFVGNHFPLHDGGFFYVLIQELISNNFSLPAFSSYNNANIPFLYPPFGFYFVGGIEFLFGVDRLQLMQVVPLLVTSLTVPAFYFLAFEILKRREKAFASALIFSLLPYSYKWLIMGGGITRSFGALFAVLALIFLIRFFREGRWQAGVLCALSCGLTVLSHPEWAWFLFYSIGIYLLVSLLSKQKKVLLRSALILFGTALVILPWVLKIYSPKVLHPLQDSGFSRAGEILKFLMLSWSGELLFPVLTVLALIGLGLAIKEKALLMVVWLPAVFILQGRAANQKAVIPLALLAGMGLVSLADWLNTRHPGFIKSFVFKLLGAFVLIYTVIGSMISVIGYAQPLSAQELESISWIGQATPANSNFLMLSGEGWVEEDYSEWMVSLTGRNSVSLVQGYEWMPDFSGRIAKYDQIQYQYSRGMEPLITWLQENDIAVDYLIIPKLNTSTIGKSNVFGLHWEDARGYPGVETAYENDEILILDITGIE